MHRRQPKMRRRIELGSGLLAGVLGVVGLAYAVLGATGSFQSGMSQVSSDGTIIRTTTAGTTTLAEHSFSPITIAFVGIALLCVVGTVTGAYLHSRWEDRAGFVVLWTCTALLLVGSLVSGFSIGLFLLPSAVLALVAAVAGSRTRDSNDHAIRHDRAETNPPFHR